jgi:hypothetical protein
MRIAALMLLICSVGHAQMPVWRDVPPVYKLDGGAITASDGGKSTNDFYLLTDREYGDFVLSFDLTRLEAGGDRLRAIVVWGMKHGDEANRWSYFLPVDSLAVGQTRHFELAKIGDRVTLGQDGTAASIRPAAYGAPLDRGAVGLLHYYNYGFRYTNVSLTPLEPESLVAPRDLKAEITAGGAVQLTWGMPAPFAGIVGYEVRRQSQGEPATAVPCVGESFSDPTVRSRTQYAYTVAPTLGGKAGPASNQVTVTTRDLPAPAAVQGLTAMRRVDGSVRVTWQLPTDSRCAGVTIQALKAGVAGPAQKLEAGATTSLVAAGAGDAFMVSVLDPDGKKDASATAKATAPAPEVSKESAWPTDHPFLRYSTEDIARLRAEAARDDQVAALIRSARSNADGLIRQPAKIAEGLADGRSSEVGPITTVAQAYMLTGEDKYAAWVREAIMRYASVYPTMPVVNGRTRLCKTPSGLYEATWYVPLICAYDMVYNSPVFSTEDHARIERDLLRPAADLFWVKDYENRTDPRVGDLHYRCYNFQAWFISAVGLTGLLLRDPDMVEYAIDGPYGLKHLIAHDVRDDGIFWERSLGYHSFVLSALLPFLEGAYHCNLDLWRMEVADDQDDDRAKLANYSVQDGDNGPKSMRLMFQGPLHTIFGDRTYANISDSNAGPLTAYEAFRVAWKRYSESPDNPADRDLAAAIAWLYQQDRPSRAKGVLWEGPKDLSGAVRFAYDDEHLYIAAHVVDETVRNSNTRPGDVWAGDAVWVGLKWRAEQGGAYDFIYGLSPGDFGKVPPVAAVFNRFQAAANEVSAADMKVKRTADGYDLEAAIPWSEFAPREGEKGTAFRPTAGDTITSDVVLYDGDAGEGSTRKDMMLAWASSTDRYDSAQGGKLTFGAPASGERALSAPRATGIKVDGDLSEWEPLGATVARIGEGSAITTDTASETNLTSWLYGTPPAEGARFDLRGTKFANNGVLQAGCSLFPSSGFAVLRERLDETGLPPRDATCATLNCGPHGGGHGHSDKLSLVLYADGRQWIPDFGSCPYESREKATWTAQTISHNTLVVDETSQLPTGGGTPGWPCDSYERQARAFVDTFRCDDVAKVAAASSKVVYPGVGLRRTVVMVGDSVVDFYEAQSDVEHQYDYALHIAGKLAESSVALTAAEGALSDKPGYQWIINVQRGPQTGALATTWTTETANLRISAAPDRTTEVIVGDGITNATDRRMPMLILRREAAQTIFATVMQPNATDSLPEWLAVPAGVTAVRVPTANGTALVVLNTTGQAQTVDGLRATARVTVRLTAPDGTVTVREY